MSLLAEFKKIVAIRSLSPDHDIVKFMSNLEDAEEQLLWLQCLESAGVDNWSGCDYAADLMRDAEDE